MIVRVLRGRHGLWFARALTSTVALTLLAILIADLGSYRTCVPLPGLCLPEQAPSSASYLYVTALMLLAALGPWLVAKARGRVTRVVVDGDRLVVDGRSLERAAIASVSMARAHRGVSLAVAWKRRRWFFELENEKDARAMASRLVPTQAPRETARRKVVGPIVRVALSAVQVAATLAYAWAALFDGPVDKSVAGVAAVVVAQLLAIETWLRRTDAPGRIHARRPTRFDEHEALHRDPERRIDLATDTSGDRSHEEREVEARSVTAMRADESTAAWLGRLDGMRAIFAQGGAYRSPVADRQVLWELLRSESHDVEAKIGAARLLRIAYGEDPRVLARVVTDPDERTRVEAAELEPEDAAARLEAFGPLFRAR